MKSYSTNAKAPTEVGCVVTFAFGSSLLGEHMIGSRRERSEAQTKSPGCVKNIFKGWLF